MDSHDAITTRAITEHYRLLKYMNQMKGQDFFDDVDFIDDGVFKVLFPNWIQIADWA